MLSGTKLGRYEVREKIGYGGMGEVYLAHDRSLDRAVALKVLLPEFYADEERVARFKHEAKAASALNHPNIITIYEVGEEEGRLYIATELVRGETLRKRIERGDIDVAEAVRITEQIADALAVAHEAHIIHRDIKPENIMIRSDGIPKILDFGLAKPMFGKNVGSEDATVRLVETQAGLVMGSVRYMSPEQARGKATDVRTDIWSLGVVLYEIVTGINPFDGETVSDSLAAVIHLEPPEIEGVPDELQRILRKALKKKPEERYQTIKDMALDLRDLRDRQGEDLIDSGGRRIEQTTAVRRQTTDETMAATHRTLSSENRTTSLGHGLSNTQETVGHAGRFPKYFPVVLVVLSALLALGGWWVLPELLANSREAFRTIRASRFTENGTARMAELSPDGRFAAYINVAEGKRSLVVKQTVAGTSVTVVEPTSLEMFQPSFSPDGNYIFYVLVDRGVGTLFRTSALGGERQSVLVDVDSRVTLSPDGNRLAFIRHDPNRGGDSIIVANSNGSGEEVFLQTKDLDYDRFVAIDWSPDGEMLMTAAARTSGADQDSVWLAAADLKEKTLRSVGESGWSYIRGVDWLRDGSGLVVVGRPTADENSQIWHVSYPTGQARQVTTDTSDYVSVSISDDGETIVATRVETMSAIWTINASSGEMKQVTVDSRQLLPYKGITQMPDGRIIYVKAEGTSANLFISEANGLNERQLTNDKRGNYHPSVSPDGKYVAFTSNRGGSESIWRINSDGSNPVQLTAETGVMDHYPGFTADGRSIIFARQTRDGGRIRAMRVSVDGGAPAELFPEAEGSQIMPVASNDGKSIAYHNFMFTSAAVDHISTLRVADVEGKREPLDLPLATKEFAWSPDDKSLTFIDRTGIDNLFSISLADGRKTPITRFTSGNIASFRWSNDGRQIFMIRPVYTSDLVLIRNGEGE